MGLAQGERRVEMAGFEERERVHGLSPQAVASQSRILGFSSRGYVWERSSISR